ncbi:hypothetical protein [Actibacterium ureilyticum]|uniref:hypothetical protein n=1 Tax=Actibacterium ureilyticum TaxID=1590614 RepID=UPI000BAAE688
MSCGPGGRENAACCSPSAPAPKRWMPPRGCAGIISAAWRARATVSARQTARRPACGSCPISGIPRGFDGTGAAQFHHRDPGAGSL